MRKEHVEFACRFCFKGFPQMDSLKKHKTETHARTFVECDISGKTFSKYLLANHFRFHSANKLFKCEI